MGQRFQRRLRPHIPKELWGSLRVGGHLGYSQQSGTQIPPADVVIGGPPCQGFSLLNKNRQGDSRKQLWRPYFEIVECSGAQVFVMENVPQLLGSFEHGEIMGMAEAMGFKCWGEVLSAADYGVPQTRRRAFIIGCKFFDPSQVFPPRRTHFDSRKGGAQLAETA